MVNEMVIYICGGSIQSGIVPSNGTHRTANAEDKEGSVNVCVDRAGVDIKRKSSCKNVGRKNK